MRSILSRSRVGRVAGLAVAILLVAACTESGGPDVRSAVPTGSLAPAASTAPEASMAASASTGAGGYSRGDYGTQATASSEASTGTPGTYVVNVASGGVGAYLTGAGGRTLYTFKSDGANASACTGSCAENWPPFAVGAGSTVSAGAGVKGKLTTFARSDGTMQVAYNAAPLYYFRNDAKAGDTNGQGAAGKWFVAAP